MNRHRGGATASSSAPLSAPFLVSTTRALDIGPDPSLGRSPSRPPPTADESPSVPDSIRLPSSPSSRAFSFGSAANLKSTSKYFTKISIWKYEYNCMDFYSQILF